MKKLILMLSFLMSIGFYACRKSPQDTTVSDGFLIGYRAEKCLCCPGNLIKIGNDTLQFEQFPPNSPKVTIIYPHPISVEWIRDTSVCAQLNPKSIIITRLIKI
jgi:hypothetical protein